MLNGLFDMQIWKSQTITCCLLFKLLRFLGCYVFFLQSSYYSCVYDIWGHTCLAATGWSGGGGGVIWQRVFFKCLCVVKCLANRSQCCKKFSSVQGIFFPTRIVCQNLFNACLCPIVSVSTALRHINVVCRIPSILRVLFCARHTLALCYSPLLVF